MRHTTTTALFQRSLQTTDRWLKEIAIELGWSDLHKAYTALRATLQALRQQLPVDECAQLSAQLPLVLRGVYWEGWDPHCAKVPRAAFLKAVHAAFKHDPEVDPERVAHAVFNALAREISTGEMADIRGILPRDLRRLIPEPPRSGEPVSSRLGRQASLPRRSTSGALREPAVFEPGDIGAAHWGG